jgi:4-amino-4-deoxy-L-arabinose transferase-like glycosyltransferase
MTCILALFVIAVIRLHPVNLFGVSEDDSIYFSSAKALASGKGYVLPSVPGTPAATKYPILYPWILSWIWRLNPSFPANVVNAVAISVSCGVIFLILAYLFLRRLKGIGEAEALVLTAFCALHPLIVYFSGQVISDVPFAALALGAMLSAETAVEPDAGFGATARCGLITGLAMLMRVFGVTIAAGILATMVTRRAWRQFGIFSGCIAPFFAALAWGALFRTAESPLVSRDLASSLGWVRTWTYYTSYLAAWKVAVPNTHILVAMLKNNALAVLCRPAYYLLYPVFVRDTLLWPALVAVVAAAMLGGIVRQAHLHKAKPIHFVLPAYMALMLLWNYPLAERFFIPFLPLFIAGIWLEIKNILGLVRTVIVENKSTSERFLAAALSVVIAIFGGAVAFNYVGGTRSSLAEQSRQRGELAVEKQEVYRWIARSTASKSRVVAYEDASVYLYANRVAIRPITFTTDAFYEPSRLEEDLDHLTDVARAIKADYWVFADDDYAAEWQAAEEQGHMRTDKVERSLPIVYRSQYGHVRVGSLECLQHPESPSCRSIDQVLFPSPDGPTVHQFAER